MYRGFAIAVVLLYSVAAFRGVGWTSPKRGLIPKEARMLPGGYRSYQYWRGGK